MDGRRIHGHQVGLLRCVLQRLNLPLQRLDLPDILRLIHLWRLGHDLVQSRNLRFKRLNALLCGRCTLLHTLNPAGDSGESLAGIVLHEKLDLDGFYHIFNFD